MDPEWPPPSDHTGAEGSLPSEREHLIDLGLGLMIPKRNPQDPVELRAASLPDPVSSQQRHIGGALLDCIREEGGQQGFSPDQSTPATWGLASSLSNLKGLQLGREVVQTPTQRWHSGSLSSFPCTSPTQPSHCLPLQHQTLFMKMTPLGSCEPQPLGLSECCQNSIQSGSHTSHGHDMGGEQFPLYRWEHRGS